MNYWLMKSEPNTFSIMDLKNRPNQTEHWDGVRNYQARNMLRDQMKKGDLAFFYHSNAEPSGIAGIVKIIKEGYPDFKAWDPTDDHYDPKSTEEKPQWYMVDVKFEKQFKRLISLTELRENPALKNMTLLRKGNRLSIMSVSAEEWKAILEMI
ncbi:MAG: EVE domain-containing protein [Proteobacteria bacterium]|nr:EVE domain-containing protein [Pseudomonadota bacterium]